MGGSTTEKLKCIEQGFPNLSLLNWCNQDKDLNIRMYTAQEGLIRIWHQTLVISEPTRQNVFYSQDKFEFWSLTGLIHGFSCKNLHKWKF